jgi:hypothetical protein
MVGMASGPGALRHHRAILAQKVKDDHPQRRGLDADALPVTLNHASSACFRPGSPSKQLLSRLGRSRADAANDKDLRAVVKAASRCGDAHL